MGTPHFYLALSQNLSSYNIKIKRSVSLSHSKNNNSKTIQWKKLRNFDVIEDNYIRHFSKF